jgi:hypothetical protein
LAIALLLLLSLLLLCLLVLCLHLLLRLLCWLSGNTSAFYWLSVLLVLLLWLLC